MRLPISEKYNLHPLSRRLQDIAQYTDQIISQKRVPIVNEFVSKLLEIIVQNYPYDTGVA